MSISKWNEQYEGEADDRITKEMFLRDMLTGEPVRRKKKGSKEYRPHDNRDALPFIVKVKTPDPYTSPDEMLKEAKRNSEIAKKQKKSKLDRKKLSNLGGMDSKYAKNAISASIYSRTTDGTLYKVLGQFELDKNTNCGDLVEVSGREFEVVTARSQFKWVSEYSRVAERIKRCTELFSRSILSLVLLDWLWIDFICHVNIYISIGMLGENVSTQFTCFDRLIVLISPTASPFRSRLCHGEKNFGS